jgi:hypothetical protein
MASPPLSTWGIKGILQSLQTVDKASLLVPQLMHMISPIPGIERPAAPFSLLPERSLAALLLERMVLTLVPHSWQKRSPGINSAEHPRQVGACSAGV